MNRARVPAYAALVLAAVLWTHPSAVLAWGNVGHRVVGALAEDHLTPEAARGVEAVLGAESLAQAATWADFVRSDPEWRKADDWHWVTLPGETPYEETEKNPNGDLIEALRRFEATLADSSRPLEDRRHALRFLAHFVGDLHQPLHVGTGEDRGGNDEVVFWFDEGVNLHALWDSHLIESEDLSYSELADFLRPTAAEQAGAWRGGSYLDWAEESRALRPLVYDLGNQRLSWQYRYRALPVVHRRLAQAGVRLAAVLNRVFASP